MKDGSALCGAIYLTIVYNWERLQQAILVRRTDANAMPRLVSDLLCNLLGSQEKFLHIISRLLRLQCMQQRLGHSWRFESVTFANCLGRGAILTYVAASSSCLIVSALGLRNVLGMASSSTASSSSSLQASSSSSIMFALRFWPL